VASTANGGPAAARNTAFRAARGAFIALLDSDDLFAPTFLERQLAVLEQNPDVSIVTSNAINLGGGRAFDGKPFWPRMIGLETLSLRDLIEHEDTVCILSMFRRHVVDRIGCFDLAFTGNEDYEFWLRAALAGMAIVRNFEPLGCYRRRDHSLSSDEPRMIRGVMRVLRHVETRLENQVEEREAARRQIARFTSELQRAELRASLERRDAAAAARALGTLAANRRSWTLAACARLTSRWPQPLLWAYRLRRGLRAA